MRASAPNFNHEVQQKIAQHLADLERIYERALASDNLFVALRAKSDLIRLMIHGAALQDRRVTELSFAALANSFEKNA